MAQAFQTGLRRMAGILAVGASAGLGACSTGDFPVVWQRSVEQTIAQPYLSYAASGGPVLVDVLAPPPGVDTARLAASMPAPITVLQARWTTDPALAAYPEYHLVVSFGAPEGSSAQAACAGRPSAAQVEGRLLAVWCYRERALSEVTARSMPDAMAREANHEALRQVMGSVLNQMFPLPDTGDDDGGCGSLFGVC